MRGSRGGRVNVGNVWVKTNSCAVRSVSTAVLLSTQFHIVHRCNKPNREEQLVDLHN